MRIVLYLCLGFAGLIVLVAVVWRLASRRYSVPCPSWLGWIVELDHPFKGTNRAEVILDHSELQPGMTVLDVGCGPGRLTIPAAQRVGPQGRVIAIDLQARMLRRAQERAQAANLNNIRYVQLGLGEGQLDVGPADRALLVSVLGEIPHREAALREVFAALKPGGLLSVTEFIFDPHFQSRELVRRLASAVGFHEKAVFGNRLAFTMQLEKPL